MVVVCRNEQEGLQITRELGSEEGRAIFVKTDVSSSKSIRKLIEKTIKVFGKL